MSRNDESPGCQTLRSGRWSEVGRAYLLTTVTHQRARLFEDWPNGQLMSRLLANAATWPGANVLAWVLMPDHWHGLVVLEESISLATLMKRAKGRSAREFNRASGRRGFVWNDGFHDRALRHADDLRAVARYIIANPIRAGLVDSVANYPFWDAAWLTSDNPEPWAGL